MPDFPPVGIQEHGSSLHDATVSKKRVSVIQIGYAEAFSGTTYSTMEDCAVPVDLSKFDKIEAIYFFVDLMQCASGTYTVYGQLYDITGNASVSGTELSASLGQWAKSRQKTADIKANLVLAERWYCIQGKVVSGGLGRIYSAGLIIVQSE